MNTLPGLIAYEFRMFLRRWSTWVPLGLVYLLYISAVLSTPVSELTFSTNTTELLQDSGRSILSLNLLLPIVAGLVVADRMVRDWKLGVRELQLSTPLSRLSYILGKYLGALISTFILPLGLIFLIDCVAVIEGESAIIFATSLVAFGIVTVPTFAFVVALSLVIPLVMPLRIYQVLFTGYWFWGNYLSPNIFPSISRTLLNISGRIPFEGFYKISILKDAAPFYSTLDAIINLLLMALGIFAALFVAERYLTLKADRF